MSESLAAKNNEPALFDIEKEFLSHFHNDVRLIHQLTTWVKSFDPNKPADTTRYKIPVIKSNRQFSANNYQVFHSDNYKQSMSNREGRWTLSAQVSPVSLTQRPGGSSILGQQTSYENSVSGSVLAGYKIGKKVVFKSGVILSQLKQTTRIASYPQAYASEMTPFKTANIGTTSGNVNLDRTAARQTEALYSAENLPQSVSLPELKQEFRYIEIPFQMVYKLIDHKINLGITGGISSNILVGNRAGYFENGEQINNGQTANLRDITYSGAVGLEFGYDLNSKVTLNVEPRIKRFLNSLSSNKDIDFKPYQIDIMTGITYSFN